MTLEPIKRAAKDHAELEGVTFPMRRDDGTIVTVHVTTDALDKLGGDGDSVAKCEENRADLEAVAVSKDDGISLTIIVDEDDV
jgi:hypothetical protein